MVLASALVKASMEWHCPAICVLMKYVGIDILGWKQVTRMKVRMTLTCLVQILAFQHLGRHPVERIS